MLGYCYYIGEDKSIVARLERASKMIWGDIKIKTHDSFHIIFPKKYYKLSYCENKNTIGGIYGYVRYDTNEFQNIKEEQLSFSHNSRFIREISKENNWPLGDNVTGCFSAVSYQKSNKEVILCNDIIGYLPLYYAQYKSGLFGGTSLIILGKTLGGEIDITGVLQRISSCGYYSNFGNRTILRKIKRMLPGEYLKYSLFNRKFIKKYDNTLYNNVQGGKTIDVAMRALTELNNEITLATNNIGNLSLALSGGLDSRILLAALSNKKDSLTCHTIGSPDLYESKLAKICAQYIGSPIRFYPFENNYFPEKDMWKKIVTKTEATGFLHWIPLIKQYINLKTTIDKYLIIGGITDNLDCRNVLAHHSRISRKRNFYRNLLNLKHKFHEINKIDYNSWKTRLSTSLITEICQNINKLGPALIDTADVKTITENTLIDLELGYKRIEDQMPPYVELLDEIFRWFHYSRFFMGSQLLQANSISNILVPSMSLGFTRFSSNIHPSIKLRRNLLNAMVQLKGFDKLGKLPTSTIPFVGPSSPKIIQELIWAGRHFADDLLIKRMLKSKKVRDNERLFKSFSYAKEYNRTNTLSNVSNWYSGKWINPESYLNTVMKRADLMLWPSVNTDIAVPGNISTILDLIYE